MHPDQLKELIVKYNAGTLGPEEKGLLDAWYLQLSRNEQVEIDEADMQLRLQMVWNQLETHSQVPYNAGQGQRGSRNRRFHPGRRRAWVPYAAAAAIGLSVLSGSVYLYQRQAVKNEQSTNNADIAPGGNRAVLTLPDGNTILLDQAGEGQLADQGGARVIKVEKGVLAYRKSDEESDEQATVSYHTLATPRGGQYEVILPDGTRVWLNASSTLRYPGRFTGAQRRVSLSGEGYFEVASAETPFVVATAVMEAEVLGTHFNIKAYRQEENKTTLLEGSLLVTAVKGPPVPERALAETPAGAKDRPGNEAGNGRLLRPGQEAVLRSQGELLVREADIEMAVAWKNGLFKFRNDSLTTVMRDLARWYNVEVVYQGKVPDKVFTGEIYRNLNASQVLEVLGYTGLHFSIQGKKIIVKE